MTGPAPGPATGPVLVVEDDASVAALIGWALEPLGLPVEVVATGDAALARLAAAPAVAAAVLDLGLPGRPGLEVLAVLRRAAATAALPVLVLSASDAGAAAAAHGAAFLGKPFAVDALAARVAALVGAPAPPPDGAAAGGAP